MTIILIKFELLTIHYTSNDKNSSCFTPLCCTLFTFTSLDNLHHFI